MKKKIVMEPSTLIKVDIILYEKNIYMTALLTGFL